MDFDLCALHFGIVCSKLTFLEQIAPNSEPQLPEASVQMTL